MNLLKQTKIVSAKLLLNIMHRIEDQVDRPRHQRLLVSVEDGKITNIIDASGFNLVPADDVHILRRNLRLMSRQAAVMSGDACKDLLGETLMPLSGEKAEGGSDD